MERAIVRDMADRDYRLIVEGDLIDNLDAAFDGMLLTRAEGNTTLRGAVRSQSDLEGSCLVGLGPANGSRPDGAPPIG